MRRHQGDHPRVCGEHSALCILSSISWGSSPRMRGTPWSPRQSPVPYGIIPAYAGNTIIPECNKIPERDHPRVCGEHRTNATGADDQKGSSPRMRGTLPRGGLVAGDEGIIPAYAGNTHPAFATCGPNRDHPRVCGEHWVSRASTPSMRGSSPRMRGTPIRR